MTKPDLILGIAGLPGAGKSTLARSVAAQIHGRLFSFGNFFRAIAIEPDVQTFGNEYISNNLAAHVVENFLRFYDDIPADGRWVIEGIRHIAIWEALRERTDWARLVFLDVRQQVLLHRLMIRAKITMEEARRRLNHPVEAEVSQLRGTADIVLSEPSQEEALRHVMDALSDLL